MPPSPLFVAEVETLRESRRFPCGMLRAAITTTYINFVLSTP